MNTPRDWIVPTAILLAVIVAMLAAIRAVLDLPGVPYNVSELFLDNASYRALTFFAFTVLWIGAGAMLVARVMSATRRPFVVLPVALIVVSLVSKMLVSRAVTYESLDDILGTNNLFGLVTQQQIWGSWWHTQFLAIGVDTIDFLERRVRYTALYSIPTLCIAAAFLPIAMRTAHSRRLTVAALVGLGVIAVAWIGLCGTIVLTWAATDNLTELIAGVGPLGVPGPFYLLALLLLTGGHAAAMIDARRSASSALAAVVCSIAAIPASWWLLNAGLEQHVHKYGFVFPATQFLLGPDRQHTLTPTILFARWAAVYVAGVVSVAVGGWIAGAFVEAARSTSRRRPAAAAAS